MKTFPQSITIQVTCRITGERHTYEVPLEDYGNIELDVETELEEIGWIDQCSPGNYEPFEDTDSEYDNFAEKNL